MNQNNLQEIYNSGELLNIAATTSSTRALGPGLRAAVWVQGCPRHCLGCIAPDWLALKPRRLVSPDALLKEVVQQPIQGLTISGGDPMLQAAGLAEFVRLARKDYDLDIICYTGYEYAELLAMKSVSINRLLSQIDVLIDGPYVEVLNDNLGLRGSSNQHIIHLTNRLRGFEFEKNQRKLEIKIDDGEIFAVGVPEKGVRLALDSVNEKTHKAYRGFFSPPTVRKIKVFTEKQNERA